MAHKYYILRGKSFSSVNLAPPVLLPSALYVGMYNITTNSLFIESKLHPYNSLPPVEPHSYTDNCGEGEKAQIYCIEAFVFMPQVDLAVNQKFFSP